MRDHGVFEPGDLSGLDFQTWLAQIDDGFLDQFDDVIFYGCFAGGYAAAAYSVSYPMATVIAINPQATLNPSIAS